MCTCFEWGLNEDIQMLVRAHKLKEFVVSSKRAQKMEDMCHEKNRAKLKLRDSGKQSMTRSFPTPSLKKSKDAHGRFSFSSRFSRDRDCNIPTLKI